MYLNSSSCVSQDRAEGLPVSLISINMATWLLSLTTLFLTLHITYIGKFSQIYVWARSQTCSLFPHFNYIHASHKSIIIYHVSTVCQIHLHWLVWQSQHSTSLNYSGSNNLKKKLNKSDNRVICDIDKIKSQFRSSLFQEFVGDTFLSHFKSAKHLSGDITYSALSLWFAFSRIYY